MSRSSSSASGSFLPGSDVEGRLRCAGLTVDTTVLFPVKVISRPLCLWKHEAIAFEFPRTLPDVFARRREHLLKLGKKDKEKCAAICPEPSGYCVMEFSVDGFTVSVLSPEKFKRCHFTEVPTAKATQHRTEKQLLDLCLTVTGKRHYELVTFNCLSWTAEVVASLEFQARAEKEVKETAKAATEKTSAAVAAKDIAESEITSLQAALQVAHAQVSALKDAKDVVDRENVALKKESEDEIAALKRALHAAHAEVATIKSDTRAETDVLEAKLQASHAEVAAIKDAKVVAEGESAAMKASLETAQSEVADVKAKTQSEIADAKRELVGVQAAKDFLERELTARKEADSSNQRELQQARIAKAVAEAAAEAAQKMAASLQAELERVRADKTTAEVAAAVATDRLSARRLGRSTCSGSLSSWVHGVPSAARHADAAESTTSSSSAGNPSD